MKNQSRLLTFAAAFVAALFIVGCGVDGKNGDSVSGDKLNLEKLALTFRLDDTLSVARPDTVTSGLETTNSIPLNRDDLEKMRTVVRMYSGSTNAGITVPGFGGAKLGKDETNLNVYYLETKVVNNAADSIVYGCGYSIHYLFKKVERGIDIANLPSVAASAQLNSKKTQVYYSIQSYGLSGITLTKFFKPTINKNFNVDGFGIMQSSIDGIHGILGDSLLSSHIRFKPEIIKFVRPYELEQP